MEYFFNFDKLAYVSGKKPEGCILCLIRDKSPDIIDLSVFDNKLFIVSVNLYPYNPGHLIIFPKRHLEDIREYTTAENKMLIQIKTTFLDILDELYNPNGYNLGYNMGKAGGASIKHLHMHIIPRYPGELGIGDLIAGKRMLVENPLKTAEKIKNILHNHSSSIFLT